MDKSEIITALETILNSNEFGDSSTYKNLLSYLVQASLDNKIPKEITVAIEVFEKDANFNSNKDSTVRHHVHTLRKKLDKYYHNEGITEKIRLMIPKGHYEVKFTKKRTTIGYKLLSVKLLKNPWWYSSLLLFSAIIILLLNPQQFSLNNPDSSAGGSSPFWRNYFENNYPTAIIIGDDFLIDEFNEGLDRYRQIRDWEINSEADLNKFLLMFPAVRTWQSEIKGIPPGMISNLFDLFAVVRHYDSELSFNLSSEINLDLLKKHNLIYIGEFQNLRVLNKVIFSLPLRYQYGEQEKLYLLSEKSDTAQTFLRIEAPYQQEDKFNVDYSVLVSMPGPSNEHFLFIAGFGYSGRLERTRMLKDPSAFNNIINESGYTAENFPQYFIMIFEVESIERTGFKNTLKHFKAYDENFFK